MLSISALIDFLLNLLRDDDARAEFEQDPQAALAQAGLAGVSARDVRDAATILGDSDGISCRSYDRDDDRGSRSDDRDDHGSRSHDRDDHGSRSHHHDDDPVTAIHHVTKHYHADEGATVKHSFNTYNEYNVSYVDNSTNAVNIDDRDTVIVGEDVNVTDSFNGDSGATIIQDSGNSDDDTVVVIEDSFDTVHNDVTAIDDSVIVDDSFNRTDIENDVVAIDEGSNNTVVQDSANEEAYEDAADPAAVA